MKSRLLLLVISFALVFTSCSEDDSVPNNTLAGDNGFEFNRTAYVTDMIYINGDNEIILSSADITSGTSTQVNFAAFSTLNGELKEKTYNVGQGLTGCSAIVSGTLQNGNVQDGINILGEENAENGFMRIVYLDELDRKINIIFEFVRNDGQLVAGSFSGSFERI